MKTDTPVIKFLRKKKHDIGDGGCGHDKRFRSVLYLPSLDNGCLACALTHANERITELEGVIAKRKQ